MFTCLDGTTQKRVSKLAEERDGNWTPTSMKSQGINFSYNMYRSSVLKIT